MASAREDEPPDEKEDELDGEENMDEVTLPDDNEVDIEGGENMGEDTSSSSTPPSREADESPQPSSDDNTVSSGGEPPILGDTARLVHFSRGGNKPIEEYSKKTIKRAAIDLMPLIEQVVKDALSPMAHDKVADIIRAVVQEELGGVGVEELRLENKRLHARFEKMQASIREAYVGLNGQRTDQLKLLSLLSSSHTLLQVNEEVFFSQGVDGDEDAEAEAEAERDSVEGMDEDEASSVGGDSLLVQISKRLWGEVRLITKLWGPAFTMRSAMQAPSQADIVRCYDQEQYILLHNIICQPEFIQSTSFGAHRARLDSGKFERLPSYIKKLDFKSGYSRYLSKLSAADRKWPVPHLVFVKLFKIKAPYASQMLKALDISYVHNCFRLPSSVAELIIYATESPATRQYRDTLLEQLERVKENLRHGIKEHLRPESVCKEHSLDHLLGRVEGQEEKEDEEEDGSRMQDSSAVAVARRCTDCDLRHVLVANIAVVITKMQFPQKPPTTIRVSVRVDDVEEEEEEEDHDAVRAAAAAPNPSSSAGQIWADTPCRGDPESRAKLLTHLDRIGASWNNYAGHTARSTAEKTQFQALLDSLQPDMVLIVADWKMKLNELFQREGQDDWFAKSGTAYHGNCFIRRRREDELEALRVASPGKEPCLFDISFFDTAMDGVAETGRAVAATLEMNMKEWKARPENSLATSYILLTDGAGCYSGTFLFMFLAFAYCVTGMRCIAHYVSEAGTGKTLLDTHFAYIMKFLLAYVAQGDGSSHDIRGAADVVKAIMSGKGIANTVAREYILDKSTFNAAKYKEKLNLSKYHAREVNYDNAGNVVSITCRLMRGRGPSQIFQVSELDAWFATYRDENEERDETKIAGMGAFIGSLGATLPPSDINSNSNSNSNSSGSISPMSPPETPTPQTPPSPASSAGNGSSLSTASGSVSSSGGRLLKVSYWCGLFFSCIISFLFLPIIMHVRSGSG